MKISRLSSLTLTLAVAAFALGYSPSFADKPKCGDNQNEHCNHGDDGGGGGGGGGGGKAKFSVSVSGLTSGDSLPDHPWRTTSKRGIGESDPHEDAPALVNFDASYFADKIPDGDNCFPAIGTTTDTVREASIRERRGAMESMFWFRGETNDKLAADREVVTYILHMDGTTVGDFPPDNASLQVEMDSWRINVANGQSDVEPFACAESNGFFNPTVLITVTPEL